MSEERLDKIMKGRLEKRGYKLVEGYCGQNGITLLSSEFSPLRFPGDGNSLRFLLYQENGAGHPADQFLVTPAEKEMFQMTLLMGKQNDEIDTLVFYN
jgi:hypothetical protein